MGQRDGLSYYDMEKINRMYQCGVNRRREFNQPIPNYSRPIQSINSIRTLFDTYTSPKFWGRVITNWVFPQRQNDYNQYQDYGYRPSFGGFFGF